MKKPLFNLLAKTIADKNHTRAWLAKRSGLTQTAIRNLELGWSEPKLSSIVAICKALGCNAQDIWPELEDVV